MKEIHGHCFPSMGCRSFLSEYSGDPDKFYGRNNCGVVSLNLPYIAAEAVTEGKDFWDVLYSYADLAHKAHQTRLKRILNTSIDSVLFFGVGVIIKFAPLKIKWEAN